MKYLLILSLSIVYNRNPKNTLDILSLCISRVFIRVIRLYYINLLLTKASIFYYRLYYTILSNISFRAGYSSLNTSYFLLYSSTILGSCSMVSVTLISFSVASSTLAYLPQPTAANMAAPKAGPSLELILST